MCYFVSLSSPRKALEEYFQSPFHKGVEFEPSYYFSGFDFPLLPVVTQEKPDVIQVMNWGLIPNWVKDERSCLAIRSKTLNARSETLVEKPSFRNLIERNRCVVPINGFFEWQSLNKKRHPWYIYQKEQAIFCLAGLFDRWENSSTGKCFESFSIITCKATGIMAEIHNIQKRMPAILTKSACQDWLNAQMKNGEASLLLANLEGGMLDAHMVSPLIGQKNVDKNTPGLIAPYIRPQGRLFE